ncbi:hypothetical protein ABZP36_029795 [Zizania latifolia]
MRRRGGEERCRLRLREAAPVVGDGGGQGVVPGQGRRRRPHRLRRQESPEGHALRGENGHIRGPVRPNARFQDDLGLDSLDTVEIFMASEEEFGFEIPDKEAEKIESIKTAVNFIASRPQAR